MIIIRGEVFCGFSLGIEFTMKEWLDAYYAEEGWYLVVDFCMFRLIIEKE